MINLIIMIVITEVIVIGLMTAFILKIERNIREDTSDVFSDFFKWLYSCEQEIHKLKSQIKE